MSLIDVDAVESDTAKPGLPDGTAEIPCGTRQTAEICCVAGDRT